MTRATALVGPAAVWFCTTTAAAQWVDYVEDPTRLVGSAPLLAADTEERDYAVGDVDQDGDSDLVVVRKQPFITPGRRANLLLMNENGILTDRTAEFASASDVTGDFGFLTPTNDQGVVLIDVNNDTWLDIVTAVTLTDNAARSLSHPRVYINLGEVGGIWQGFRYEMLRIPLLHATAGPRFSFVSAGDLTGDGAPELYFSDYDDGGPEIFDFNDRLLVNDGTGFFTDETAARMTPEMYTADFGISNAIFDMNGDGFNDVVRMSSDSVPYHIGVAYNDPSSPGTFDWYDMIYNLSAYHVAAAELNGDGRMDIVAIDDGTDRFMLNQGNDSVGRADFTSFTFGPQTAVINAGNVTIDDLDNDGWNDVIMSDMDVTLAGCNHRAFIFHNQGDPPDVTFLEEDQVVPDAMLMGVYDVASIDIDGDGWKDLVIGRCTGTEAWMNQPPFGLVISHPAGLAEYVEPDTGHDVVVRIDGLGGAVPKPGSGRLNVSTNGGPFVQSPLADIGGGLFEGTLPAGACADRLDYYVTILATDNSSYSDPPGAPAETYRTIAAAGTSQLIRDEIEGDVSGWAISDEPGLTAGTWEQAEPNATLFNGNLAAPAVDATAGAANVLAFVTENGPPGGDPTANDVDGGPTRLVSPAFDVTGPDALVSWSRWMASDGDFTHVPDVLTVEISTDGGSSWIPVAGHDTGDTANLWERDGFYVSDHATPGPGMRVRFSVGDAPNDSVTEAGIDDFQVDILLCTLCPADLDGDEDVNVGDLLTVLANWGTNGAGADIASPFDLVDVQDLLVVLAAWGGCSS